MNEDDKVFRYTHVVDEDVAAIYADEKCKDCRGRGVTKTQVTPGGTIRRGSPISWNVNYCNCVRKSQKKYG